MNFKDYLHSIRENDVLSQIKDVLGEMSDEEIDDFGYYLYTEFFDMEDEEDQEDFSIEDIIAMITELGEEMYDDILDWLQFDELELDDQDNEMEDLDEAVSRRMKITNMNRKKRKYMGISKTKLRQQKAQRKREYRKNKVARKRYYRANKQKIAAYQKSRAAAIKSGKHKVKVRRQT